MTMTAAMMTSHPRACQNRVLYSHSLTSASPHAKHPKFPYAKMLDENAKILVRFLSNQLPSGDPTLHLSHEYSSVIRDC